MVVARSSLYELGRFVTGIRDPDGSIASSLILHERAGPCRRDSLRNEGMQERRQIRRWTEGTVVEQSDRGANQRSDQRSDVSSFHVTVYDCGQCGVILIVR